MTLEGLLAQLKVDIADKQAEVEMLAEQKNNVTLAFQNSTLQLVGLREAARRIAAAIGEEGENGAGAKGPKG